MVKAKEKLMSIQDSSCLSGVTEFSNFVYFPVAKIFLQNTTLLSKKDKTKKKTKQQSLGDFSREAASETNCP